MPFTPVIIPADTKAFNPLWTDLRCALEKLLDSLLLGRELRIPFLVEVVVVFFYFFVVVGVGTLGAVTVLSPSVPFIEGLYISFEPSDSVPIKVSPVVES